MAGHCQIYPCEIKLSEELNKQEKFEVTMHECLHAISFLTDCKLKEGHIAVISDGILCLFRDNKQLLDQLVKYCEGSL